MGKDEAGGRQESRWRPSLAQKLGETGEIPEHREATKEPPS